MTKFIYNNAKNASTGYILFELNCSYYFCIFYKKKINLYLKSKLTNNLANKSNQYIAIYWNNP